MNLKDVTYTQKKNVKIVFQDFIAVAVVQLILISSMEH